MAGKGDALKVPGDGRLRILVSGAKGVFAKCGVAVGFVKKWRYHYKNFFLHKVGLFDRLPRGKRRFPKASRLRLSDLGDFALRSAL